MAITAIGSDPIAEGGGGAGAPAGRVFTMAIEYKVRISEKQRKLIMRALTTAVANNRRSASGEALNDDDWMELISVFAALNPREMVADDQPARLPDPIPLVKIFKR